MYVRNYRLLKTIGKGNFAKVKLARHMPTGVEVCVCVVGHAVTKHLCLLLLSLSLSLSLSLTYSRLQSRSLIKHNSTLAAYRELALSLSLSLSLSPPSLALISLSCLDTRLS